MGLKSTSNLSICVFVIVFVISISEDLDCGGQSFLKIYDLIGLI